MNYASLTRKAINQNLNCSKKTNVCLSYSRVVTLCVAEGGVEITRLNNGTYRPNSY